MCVCHLHVSAFAAIESQLILYHLDIYVNLKKQMLKKCIKSIWHLFACMYAVYVASVWACCLCTKYFSLAAVNHFQLCAKCVNLSQTLAIYDDTVLLSLYFIYSKFEGMFAEKKNKFSAYCVSLVVPSCVRAYMCVNC